MRMIGLISPRAWALVAMGLLSIFSSGASELPVVPAEKAFVGKIEIHVVGMTQPWAVSAHLRFHEGQEFPSLRDLENALRAQKQALLNLRIFSSVEVAALAPQAESGGTGARSYDVRLDIVDSWTLFSYAYPKYDSNIGGLRVAGRVNYNNALGTLTDLSIYGSLDWSDDWSLKNWKFSTSLGNLKIAGLTWSLSGAQEFLTDIRIENETTTLKYTVNSASLGIGTSIGLPWDINYGLGLSTSFNYGYNFVVDTNDVRSSILKEKEGITLTPSHGLGYGSVNWMGNLRSGFSLSVENAFTYNTSQTKINTSVGASLHGFKEWGGIFGLGARTSWFWELDAERNGAASAIRGVLDGKMWGDAGVFMSGTAYLSVLNIKDWFEVQGDLFFDAGVTKVKGKGFSATDWKYGLGAEVLVFPAFIKSIILRFSLGLDPSTYSFSKAFTLSQYEYFLGTGLFY